MAITVGKYRLGAPSSITLDQNTNTPVDLGSSIGGVTLTIKPTVFKAVPDQVIGAVAAWRTQLEASIEMSLPELSVAKILAASSFDPVAGVTTVASGTLGAFSPAPTATVNGTAGTTSYTYKVFAYTSNGDGIPVATTAVTTGNATLSSTNSITITWTAQTGAAGYGIERSASGGTPSSTGLLQRVPAGTLSFTDTGLAATAYTESATQPTYPSTDTGYEGSTVAIPTHRLDLVIPKNVTGSTLNWRWTFWKTLADGEVQIDWKRDKNSEYKLQAAVLMDTTQAAGQELFKLVEEY